MPTTSTDLVVHKKNFAEAEYVETELPSLDGLGPGQALLKVDTFAFTANNITYAVLGDAFHYWDFFPAAEGWGRIPVWGFAEVLASTADGLDAGERLYGYLPMSTHLLIEPGEVKGATFMDVAAHRRERSPLYNQYTLTRKDRGYAEGLEPLISLFRPLFTTSFLLDDHQASNDFFGANTVAVTSASSKTSIGLAHLLAKRKDRITLVGLTSPSNVPFVEGLGYYDTVLAYDNLDTLPVAPVSVVDMAGNADVIARLHGHLGDDLRHCSRVGATHWGALGRPGADDTGPKSEVFFAPGYAQQRIADWGAAGFQARLGEVWQQFLPETKGWMSVTQGRGHDAVLDVYRSTLTNRSNPAEGQILTLWD